MKYAAEDIQVITHSNDPDATFSETAREAYWIILYIYFKKLGCSDILPSFTQAKTKAILGEVYYADYSFDQGFLVHDKSGKKVELSAFVPVGQSEMRLKEKLLEANNMFNLNKIYRNKSEQGLLSDYPHYYRMEPEGKTQNLLYGMRASENGNFVFSQQEEVFCHYGKNYAGELVANFLGT